LRKTAASSSRTEGKVLKLISQTLYRDVVPTGKPTWRVNAGFASCPFVPVLPAFLNENMRFAPSKILSVQAQEPRAPLVVLRVHHRRVGFGRGVHWRRIPRSDT
jgi:hypothetical protein